MTLLDGDPVGVIPLGRTLQDAFNDAKVLKNDENRVGHLLEKRKPFLCHSFRALTIVYVIYGSFMDMTERLSGCLIGLAVGDALGTSLEFELRDCFDPIDDLIGGGPFELEAGEWTDDTSMALCLANSLIHSRGFDPRDQMDRYVRWDREGYCSSIGSCFDIGMTVKAALDAFEKTQEPFSGPTDPLSAGNGSIMRLAPVPMFYNSNYQQAVYYSGESSRTTHGAAESVAACHLLGSLLWHALNGADKSALLTSSVESLLTISISLPKKIKAIAEGCYRTKHRDDISGNGYVVDSLEAALWCFYQTETYRDAVLLAANLGDDADTTAAICGQLAGAHYGLEAIPSEWRQRLCQYEVIAQTADALRPV